MKGGRSELQLFYERISTLIKRSSAHPAPSPPPPHPSPPPPEVGKEAPSHSPPQSQTEKEADTPNNTAHAAADTSALAGDPPTDMVSFF